MYTPTLFKLSIPALVSLLASVVKRVEEGTGRQKQGDRAYVHVIKGSLREAQRQKKESKKWDGNNREVELKEKKRKKGKERKLK